VSSERNGALTPASIPSDGAARQSNAAGSDQTEPRAGRNHLRPRCRGRTLSLLPTVRIAGLSVILNPARRRSPADASNHLKLPLTFVTTLSRALRRRLCSQLA
jgi:hypothetical protein